MSFKQHIAIAVLALACTQAYATSLGGNSGVGHGARAGAKAGSGAVGQSSASASQSGSSGGRYQWVNPDASLVDGYQPWPESEMRQFQKP
jgi:hypothetical protein